MVDTKYWTIPCTNCGKAYKITEKSKITILSLEMIEVKEELQCPSCGKSNSIAVLKNEQMLY